VERRTERDGFYAAMEAFRIPALAERGRARIQHFFCWLNARLSDFICGPHFTIADITGMVTVDFCGWTTLPAPGT
jgi:glutathione S-transferase